jgi:CheY-like chemotaxis protein
MAGRSYRLTPAGRDAWETQDAAIPADYRRILWMMDMEGQSGVAQALTRLFPSDMLEEWLREMEEIGLIEVIPEGEEQNSGFAPGRADETLALEQAKLLDAAKEAGALLARTGAYVAMDRLRDRPLPVKAAAETVILIVEDDVDQLALADLRVSMAGYKVRAAKSVEGYLQALVRDGPPDVLLLDVELPDGNGFDVLARMRRDAEFRLLPIILLTARNEAADIGRGLLLGADGYVTKPYTRNILADVIRRVLRRGE